MAYKILGSTGAPPTALAEGSSLMRAGISWQEVADTTRVTIENWFAAGSSPSEWEELQARANRPQRTFIAVSAYDLNEESLCDSRAQIVPLLKTLGDLRATKADWAFSKRLLAQYPISYIRLFFPTVGRSDGVMVGLRQQAARLLPSGASAGGVAETAPVVAGDSAVGTLNTETEKLTDWSEARVLRRMASMRTAMRGVNRFDGPKRAAFLRMLQRARSDGRIDVLVMPVASLYTREFLSPQVNAQFEGLLAEAQAAVPEAHWCRLDQAPELKTDTIFSDFVHLNATGQQIATGLFLKALASPQATETTK